MKFPFSFRSKKPSNIRSESVTLKIEGMTCGGCTRFVDTTLQEIPGVLSSEVILESGTAKVVFNTERTDRSRIVDTINDTRFRVERILDE